MKADVTRSFCFRSARYFTLALVLMAALAGCNDKEVHEDINGHAQDAQKAMRDMQAYSPVKHYNPLVVTDKAWAGSAATRMHRGMPLPSKFEADHGVTLISSEPMSLQEIATALNVQTNIPVRINDIGGANPGGGMPVPMAGGKNTGPTMPMAYEGPMSGLLEKVSGFFGVSWHYDGSTVSISKFETRVFVIEALPGTQSISEGMQDDQGSGSSGSSGGGGGSSSGGSSSGQSSITQNSKFTIDFKYWDELDQVLTSMLGGTGTVVSSPSIGSVTITTTPEIMRTVAAYIAKENERLSRQIAITVEVYSVDMADGTDFSVNFNAVLNRLKNFGLNPIAGASAPSDVSGFSSAAQFGVAILNPFPSNTASGIASFGTNPAGGFSKGVGNVTDVFSALSGVGDTTKVAKFPLVTLNNRPASRRIGEDRTYVQSSTSANTTTGSTSNIGTEITPGVIHQGFSVQLTPRLLDDGRILLQYSLSVIDIARIPSFNSVTGDCGTTSCTGGGAGSTTIQLPDTINRIFVQQSILKSGSMLLLGGAEEEDLSHNSQGVGDAYNYILGGGTSTNRTHQMLIMAITPQVLDEPHSEQD